MTYLLIIILVLIVCTSIFMRHPKFGKAPNGKRLQQIEQSKFYHNNSFKNLSHTPALAKGHNTFTVFWNFFFKKHPNTIPSYVPSIQTNIKNIPLDQNILIWFGHSSYYFQLNGKRFLVDPVFSGNVSPIPNTAKSFEGANTYQVDDLPEIDYLLITHDHYDHLDYETIINLKNKVKQVVCPLGVGSHFEHWGYNTTQLVEKEWYETVNLSTNLYITFMPTRHFSGRTFKRNNTLWTSYLIQSNDYKLYVGGDSGYDSHFKEIGEKFGPINFALLENGQYNEAWRYIHMFPEELLQAATDLKVQRIMPIHNSKFKLAHHEWNTPLNDLEKLNDNKLNIATPKIGEVVDLDNPDQKFDSWWKN